MNRPLSLFASLALLCAVGHAETGDMANCQLRLYGTVEEAVPVFPVNKDELLRQGPTLETNADLGLIRYASPTETKYQMTQSFGNIGTKMGESDVGVSMFLDIGHAMEVDGSGKPLRAVQRTCAIATITKGNLPVGYITEGNCGTVINGGKPVPSASRSPEIDPFDPKSGWIPVKIVNGVPELVLNTKMFLETPGGSAILKAACMNSGVVTPGGPVPVKPLPKL